MEQSTGKPTDNSYSYELFHISIFRAGYLDDVSLGGEVNLIGNEVENLKSRTLKIGLSLEQIFEQM